MYQQDISALSLPAEGITTLYGLKELAKYSIKAMDLRGNSIRDFEHFGTHTDLQELHLENNSIESLLGLTKQRSLTHLNLRGNPVANHPHYRVMALLTVGFSLTTIDGRRVEPQERELARYMGPTAALAVSYGWLPDGTPHTNPEYESIISKLRAQRKAKLQAAKNVANEERFTTILSVLEKKEQDAEMKQRKKEQHQQLVNEFGDAVSSTSSQQARETIDMQRQAMSHLTEKIAKLEMEVSQARKQIEIEKANKASSSSISDPTSANNRARSPGKGPGGILSQPNGEDGLPPPAIGQEQQTASECIIGLGIPDVAIMDSVTYNPPSGFFVESNRKLVASCSFSSGGPTSNAGGGNSGGDKPEPIRCVVTVDKENITLLSFFSRSVLSNISLKTEVVDIYGDAQRRSIILRCKDGALFLLSCREEIALHSLYKSLFLLRAETPGLMNGLSQEVLDQTKIHFRPKPKIIDAEDRIDVCHAEVQTTAVQFSSGGGGGAGTSSSLSTGMTASSTPRPTTNTLGVSSSSRLGASSSSATATPGSRPGGTSTALPAAGTTTPVGSSSMINTNHPSTTTPSTTTASSQPQVNKLSQPSTPLSTGIVGGQASPGRHSSTSTPGAPAASTPALQQPKLSQPGTPAAGGASSAVSTPRPNVGGDSTGSTPLERPLNRPNLGGSISSTSSGVTAPGGPNSGSKPQVAPAAAATTTLTSTPAATPTQALELPQPADAMMAPGKPVDNPTPSRRQPNSSSGGAGASASAPVAPRAKTPPESHIMQPAARPAAGGPTATTSTTTGGGAPTPQPVTAAATPEPKPAPAAASSLKKDDDTSEMSDVPAIPKRRAKKFDFQMSSSDSDSDSDDN